MLRNIMQNHKWPTCPCLYILYLGMSRVFSCTVHFKLPTQLQCLVSLSEKWCRLKCTLFIVHETFPTLLHCSFYIVQRFRKILWSERQFLYFHPYAQNVACGSWLGGLATLLPTPPGTLIGAGCWRPPPC